MTNIIQKFKRCCYDCTSIKDRHVKLSTYDHIGTRIEIYLHMLEIIEFILPSFRKLIWEKPSDRMLHIFDWFDRITQ